MAPFSLFYHCPFPIQALILSKTAGRSGASVEGDAFMLPRQSIKMSDPVPFSRSVNHLERRYFNPIKKPGRLMT
jgi:hypothetical protein